MESSHSWAVAMPATNKGVQAREMNTLLLLFPWFSHCEAHYSCQVCVWKENKMSLGRLVFSLWVLSLNAEHVS